jgi:hypothetical protein
MPSHEFPVTLSLGAAYAGLPVNQVRMRFKNIEGRVVVLPTSNGISPDTDSPGNYPARITLPLGASGFIQGSPDGVQWESFEALDPQYVQKIAAALLGLSASGEEEPLPPVYEEFGFTTPLYTNDVGTVEALDTEGVAYQPGRYGYTVATQPTAGARHTLLEAGLNGQPCLLNDGNDYQILDALARLFTLDHPWTAGGEEYFPAIGSNNIIGASNETPIVITTNSPHGRETGFLVTIAGVLGNLAANVTNWPVTRIDEFSFSLDGRSGTGTYTSGGSVTRSAQTVIHLGNSADSLKFRNFAFAGGSTGRPTLTCRNGVTGGVVAIRGQYMLPVQYKFSWAVAFDGERANIWINAAPFGWTPATGAESIAVNRVTWDGLRASTTATQQPLPGHKRGRRWILADRAWTEAEVSAFFRQEEIRAPYNLPVFDLYQRVGDSDPFQAWPGLTHYNGQWVLAYLGGTGHASFDHVIRILTSEDGIAWTLVATLSTGDPTPLDPLYAYRDVRFEVLADGRLGLYGVRVDRTDPENLLRYTWLWISPDGTTWDETPNSGQALGEANWWIWGVRRFGDTTWGVGYRTQGEGDRLKLYRSEDGIEFTYHTTITNNEAASESDLAMGEDGTMYVLTRCDALQQHIWSKSVAPYTTWDVSVLPYSAEAPSLLWVEDVLHAGFRGAPGNRTQFGTVELATGVITPYAEAPQDGDGAYIKLVAWPDSSPDIGFAYYSTHQPIGAAKSCVFFGRLRPPDAE